MNNIEILEELIENYKCAYPEEESWCAIYPLQMKALENLIQEYKELKEDLDYISKEKWKADEAVLFLTERIEEYQKQLDLDYVEENYIPKSKVKKLAKKYEFALNDYDSSTADYKHSQNIGKYMACIELLEERK